MSEELQRGKIQNWRRARREGDAAAASLLFERAGRIRSDGTEEFGAEATQAASDWPIALVYRIAHSRDVGSLKEFWLVSRLGNQLCLDVSLSGARHDAG